MNRACPHCGQEIHVFDEECASCGKPSKPGLLKATASIFHDHRSLILLIAALVVGWIILSKIFHM
jgi:hypothetical protein